MHKFIFDVDGTLTPSRGKIDNDFKKFFVEFCMNNNVYLVTGSDKPKTVEQIGNELYSMAKRVYNCSGSEVWVGDKQIKTNDWKIPYNVRSWLLDKLEESDFSFCPEITTKISLLKIDIFEIPINYNGRTYDQGKKIVASDGLKAIWTLIKYRFF